MTVLVLGKVEVLILVPTLKLLSDKVMIVIKVVSVAVPVVIVHCTTNSC